MESQDNWQVIQRYEDQMTGSVLDRPGLQQALVDARRGRFDLLLVVRVDRLARSVRALASILEELDMHGIAFRSATEPFDTASPAGRMMVQMLGVFAEFERATIIERVIAGMQKKAAKGGWNGGKRPLGYDYDPNTGALQVNEKEASLVREIFDLYTKQQIGSIASPAPGRTRLPNKERSALEWQLCPSSAHKSRLHRQGLLPGRDVPRATSGVGLKRPVRASPGAPRRTRRGTGEAPVEHVGVPLLRTPHLRPLR